MDSTKIIELLSYTLPSVITGGVAYFLFNSYFKDQQHTRRWLNQKETQKQALPLRLQAYERLSLFLERINPSKLLIRVAPISNDKNDYADYLIASIDQEFEHNLTQQIYVSSSCWGYVVTAKNATNQMIRKAASTSEITTANELRELILKELFDKDSPSNAALAFIKDEVSDMW
ncbi:hypothetical protein [Flavobacterium tegetincola]|uniref:DUF7935 family protein n=1 Tax=Flavobacterium tegetincola TaxID=150172 RepID=UPI0003F4DF24|nr:hypothetical protein [Flavobacterium tegetincola]